MKENLMIHLEKALIVLPYFSVGKHKTRFPIKIIIIYAKQSVKRM
jgi:hypothetical protein